MLNVIAVFICTVYGIIQGVKGEPLWCIIELLLAAINLPFALEWLRHF